MKQLNNRPYAYENVASAINCLRSRLEYSVKSYEMIQPLCHYPPIKNILTETLQERRCFFYLLSMEISTLAKRRVDAIDLSNVDKSVKRWLGEFDLQACDEELVHDIRTILLIFDLPGSLKKLLGIYYHKLEIHIIRMNQLAL